MATAPSGDALLLGRGKVYFDRLTSAGVSTGERFLGNCDSLEITPANEVKEKRSSCEAAAGLLKRIVTQTTLDFSIQMNEVNKENLAAFLLGDNSTQVVAATPVVAEAHTAPALGTYFQCGSATAPARNIGSVAVKKAPSTVYVLNTDYTVDAVNGRIYVVPTGTIVPGDAITVDYTPVAHTYATVRAGVTPTIEGALRYITDNAVGPNADMYAWKVAITPDGALALLGDDFAAYKLKGGVLNMAETHPTEPYFRVTFITPTV